MPKKKETRENEFDFLETKYGATPADILKAVEQVGPYKARLETYFQVRAFSKKKNVSNGVNTLRTESS